MKILGANPLKGDASAFPALRGMPAFPRKQFAAAGYVNNHSGGEFITEVLTSANNGGWIAPPSTNRIVLIEGYGGRGSTGGVSRSWVKYSETYYYRVDGGVDMGPTVQVGSGTGYAPGGVYCDAEQPSSGVYISTQKCYYYDQFEESNPDTFGTAATIFDLTFRGGYGNEAVENYITKYENVEVIPNKNYAVSIPTNGQIKLTYTK